MQSEANSSSPKNWLQALREFLFGMFGQEFAEHCIEAIRRQGYINAVQNYFGLHYQADIMPERNEEFLRIVKEFGFAWFEKFDPKEPV